VAALERRAGHDPTAGAALAQHRARLRAPGAARHRRRRVAVAAALAVGALASAGLLRRDAGGVPPASTIAVLPFSVSGGADLAYLREGIVTLLSTQLDGGGTLRSADPRAVLGVAAQVRADGRGSGAAGGGDPAVTVARRVGAGTYVRGSIIEAGGRLLIEATAHRPGDSQPVARAQVEGPTAELFGLVDNLAGRLLSGLSEGPFEQLTRIAATTTSSLPALKAFLEGERHFRAGSFEDAARAFRHAANEDTTFALAYYWLSVAAWWTDDAATLDQAAAAAVRFSSRLRPQDRRILDGWQAFLRGDAPGAERIYRAIVRDEPEHVEAWLQLGELLFHAGPRRGRAVAEARPAFERVVEFEPEHISAIMHLSRIAATDGRLSDLDSLSRRALRIGATGEWATEARLHLAFIGGDAGALDAVLASLRTQPEGRSWNGAHYIALAHDNNIAGARRLVTILTDATRTPRVRAFGHIGLAYLALAQGRLRAAGEELGRAAALDPVMALEYRGVVALVPFLSPAPGELAALRDSASRLAATHRPAPPRENPWPTAHDGIQQDIATYLSAALALRAGDVMAARQGRDRLQARSRRLPSNAVVHDLAASLRAQLAVSANRPAVALKELEQLQAIDARADQVGSSPYYSQGLERFIYASLLEAAGRLEDAAHWYGSFSASSIFDLVFLAPSHLRRGSIAERLGQPAESRRHYEAALVLWSGCDAELRPLADDARTRLAALRRETAAQDGGQ
jgi:tetratricopeptide (TPR) repeat protein